MNKSILALIATAGALQVASAQQQYFLSQSLYPFSSSGWTINPAPSGIGCPSWFPNCYASSFYSQGNYGGMGGSLASFIYYQYPPPSGGEVEMVVGIDPTNPLGQFAAFLAASPGTVDGYSGNFFKVGVNATGGIVLSVGWTDPAPGTFYEFNLAQTSVAIPSGSVIRAILKPAPCCGASPYAQVIVSRAE